MRIALVLFLLCHPVLTAPASEQHWWVTPEWWLVIVTGVLVVVTGVLAGYTFKLWRATKSLSEDAKRTSERQASEVQESLRIGQGTIEAMERHAALQLRAYVTVRTGNIHEQKGAFGRWWLEWQPEVVNTGQTPAYEVDIVSKADLMSIPLPATIDLVKRLAEGLPSTSISRTTLGNGQSLWPAPGCGADDSQMPDLRNGTTGLGFYVWGTATYLDIFRKEHHTNFCQLCVWDSGGKPTGRYTEKHNDSD